MNIVDALKKELNIIDEHSQEAQLLLLLENKYELSKVKQFQILLKDGFKTYYFSSSYEEYELDIEYYISIVSGSWENEDYHGLSLFVETVTLGTKDYPHISFDLYLLDGIVESKSIDYNEISTDEEYGFVKKLKCFNEKKGR